MRTGTGSVRPRNSSARPGASKGRPSMVIATRAA
jgi:hypothetical protein